MVILLYKILYEKSYRFIIFILIPTFIILNLKAYIVISFLPWLMFTLFFFFVNKSKNPIIKLLVVPYLGIIIGGTIYLLTLNILDSSDKYKADEIKNRIEGFRSWHTHLKGSAYDLGEMEYTPIGYLKKVPSGINVALFRPYPWEAGNVMALGNSMESMVLFFLTLYTILKTRSVNLFKYVKNHSFLLGCFVFCLFYAYVIGITSYNFGALSRFKIPLVSFYLFTLLYILKTYNKLEKEII
jgi:hypothetical protein